MKDNVESDWTNMFNSRFGQGITRRNVEIYTPIVVDMTRPYNRYNNGTINPPIVVKEWGHRGHDSEPMLNDDIPNKATSVNPFVGLDTNPNYKGDGYYFPDYQKFGVLYDYPEWKINMRGQVPQARREFPVEIRRRLQ